ncbi:MAG: DUF3794 domain-containing protein [Ruminococcus sp.]|nr:DUF3794 domain-containing protein [Ruminococcus sp.]
MDFKINKDTVSVTECVYEGAQEQSVELDYILPDYFPDIFRLVKCEVTPSVTNRSVSGDRLSYDLSCEIKIIYCSENSSVLQCVSQHRTYSKSVDMGCFCENPTIYISASPGYINYRAVNKRRLDMRGAVSVKIKVECDKKQEIICSAEGGNIQVKKIPLRFASEKISTEKIIQISEETELSSAQMPVLSVISCKCKTSDCDKKMISGKLLAKGEAYIHLLCSCEKDSQGLLQPVSFTLPYSQIIDIDGIDDSFDCSVHPEIINCEVTPSADKNGENRLLKCELEIRLVCTAVKSSSVMVVTDAFSTTYPCTIESSQIRAQQMPVICNETLRHSTVICEGESVPETVYDICCTPVNINTRFSEEEKKLIISGMLTYTTASRSSDGMISVCDKSDAFEEAIELADVAEGSSVSAEISVSNVSYNISDANTLTAKSELDICISVAQESAVKALCHISVDDSVKKQRDGDYAIKLYYGCENENVWDIAKRYSTSVDAVIEENDLSGERLESGGMLIIPIVS